MKLNGECYVHKYFSFFILLLSCFTGTGGYKILAQNTVGLIQFQPQKVFDGYNLIFPHNQSTVFLLDNCGQIVRQWEDDAEYRPGNSVYLLENGRLIKCKRLNNSINDPIWAGGGGDVVEMRSWDNELIWQFRQNNDSLRLHHDVAPMPNGNILMISWELKSEEEAIQAGRDPETLSQGKLWPDYILEVNPETDEIVWEWHAWDHLVQDINPSKDNFGEVATHPELININWDTHDGHPDWMHANSIDYHPVLDHILLSVPYFHEVWVIDHSTTTEEAKGSTGGNAGKGGDLIYRWGNPAAYDRGTDEDQNLFFPHDIRWVNPTANLANVDVGKMSVFNNRVGEDFSSAGYFIPEFDVTSQQYILEEDTYVPEEFERIITHPVDPTLLYSNSLSSAQILPNGNMLMLAGRWGHAFEITPEDELVWEYIIPLRGGSPVNQGDTLSINNNITFQMNRYAVDFPGFEGRTLIAGEYLELAPNESFCDLTTSMDENLLNSFSLYPNPTSQFIHLSISSSLLKQVQIFDMMGREVFSLKTLSTEVDIPVEEWESGVYFLSIDGYQLAKFMVIGSL